MKPAPPVTSTRTRHLFELPKDTIEVLDATASSAENAVDSEQAPSTLMQRRVALTNIS
jgi:hypothetical protein